MIRFSNSLRRTRRLSAVPDAAGFARVEEDQRWQLVQRGNVVTSQNFFSGTDRYHIVTANPPFGGKERAEPLSTDGWPHHIPDWVHKIRAPDPFGWDRYRLQRFVEAYPELRTTDLRPRLSVYPFAKCSGIVDVRSWPP